MGGSGGVCNEKVTNYNLKFCKITVEDSKGNRVVFESDAVVVSKITNDGIPNLRVEFERLKSGTLKFSPSIPGCVKSPPPMPTYNPYMGDAASRYCEPFMNSGDWRAFRWHHVFTAMWYSINWNNQYET